MSIDHTSRNAPKTGQRCTCRPGIQRDNCPACEGTGQRIDFAAIRARKEAMPRTCHDCLPGQPFDNGVLRIANT